MKKINIYVGLLLVGGFFASCDADSVDSIDFGVNLRNEQQEIYVGDEVTFDFDGNPDYIVFYSGEDGHKYANKDRLKVDVESMSAEAARWSNCPGRHSTARKLLPPRSHESVTASVTTSPKTL